MVVTTVYNDLETVFWEYIETLLNGINDYIHLNKLMTKCAIVTKLIFKISGKNY